MVGAPLVVAQEAELAIDPIDAAALNSDPDVPHLDFCRDLKGYGWCLRKGDYLNVGLGRLERRSLPAATAQFVASLEAQGTIPPHLPWR